MINGVILENFKSFLKESKINLSNISILSGLNSGGKSSVIQGIIKFLNNFSNTDPNNYSNYNIDNIGGFKDLLSNRSDKQEFVVSIIVDHKKLSIKFNEEYPNGNIKNFTSKDKLALSSIEKFHYISAFRMGPQVYYDTHMDNNTIGEFGQNVVDFIMKKQSHVCDKILLNKNSKAAGFIENLEAWMSEITPGTKIDCQLRNEIGISYFRVGFGGKEYYRPTNVGFGISYILPIVAVLLTAKKGDLIIVENPEAHLHPKGQTIMGELIARAGKNGAQIIVETHSDHLIDGIRICLKRKIIKPNDLTINFFTKDDNDISHCKKIEAKENGELEEWPEDFFDQGIKNIAEILG